MKQHTFRLKKGQLLKEEIKKVAEGQNITAGVLLSCVGSLENAVLRMAGASATKQEVKDFAGPLEIVSATGTISKNGSHIHLAVSNEQGKVFGGHLKDGTIVDTTAEIVIGIFADVSYERTPDEETGFDELTVVEK